MTTKSSRGLKRKIQPPSSKPPPNKKNKQKERENAITSILAEISAVEELVKYDEEKHKNFLLDFKHEQDELKKELENISINLIVVDNKE